MIDRVTIDRIFAVADVVEVVGDFVTLKKKGVNYTACCPFHDEKTPSFMVSPAKGVYKCFGCGKGGGALNFVMEHEKLSYPEALRWMARKYGIEIEEVALTEAQVELNNDRESMLVLNSWVSTYFSEQMATTDEGRSIGLSYFEERGFTPLTIETYGLGYCPMPRGRDAMSRAAVAGGYKEKFLTSTGLTIIRDDGSHYDRFCGRVMFPIHSLAGRVVGFGGRTMSVDKKTAKYLNSPQSELYDKSQTLYGIFQAKKFIVAEDKCILVEGYTDVMQMHQSGILNVVASSGTSLTESQVRLIKRFTKNVTVIYDGDSAGVKASLRGIDILLREGLNVRVVPLPQGDDPDSFARGRSSVELASYLERMEEDFLRFKTRILLDGSRDDPSSRAELIKDIVHSISLIENSITREVYIRECSQMMGISYEVLSRSVVEDIVSLPVARIGAQSARSRSVSPSVVSRSGSVDVTSSTSVGVPLSSRSRRSSIVELECELVGYLVKYGDRSFDYELSEGNVVSVPVAQTIVGELTSDGIEFTTPAYASIFAAFVESLREGRVLVVGDLLSSGDEGVSSAVADILASDAMYSVSGLWTRYGMAPLSEFELLWKSVPKALLLYKSRVVEVRISSLQAQLNSGDDIDVVVVKQIQELNSIKAAIAARCKRLI